MLVYQRVPWTSVNHKAIQKRRSPTQFKSSTSDGADDHDVREALSMHAAMTVTAEDKDRGAFGGQRCQFFFAPTGGLRIIDDHPI